MHNKAVKDFKQKCHCSNNINLVFFFFYFCFQNLKSGDEQKFNPQRKSK